MATDMENTLARLSERQGQRIRELEQERDALLRTIAELRAKEI